MRNTSVFTGKTGLSRTSCKSVPGGLEPQGLQKAAVEKDDLVLEDWTGGILIVLIMIESIKNDRRRLFGKNTLLR